MMQLTVVGGKLHLSFTEGKLHTLVACDHYPQQRQVIASYGGVNTFRRYCRVLRTYVTQRAMHYIVRV